MPKEIKEASIKKIYKTDKNRYETILWLTEFIKKYKKDIHQKGLYLCGNFGCGKTYLIAAIFNELGKDGIKSAIVFWPEFLNSLKASFNVFGQTTVPSSNEFNCSKLTIAYSFHFIFGI